MILNGTRGNLRAITTFDERIWTVSSILNETECRDLIDRAEAEGFEAAVVRTSGGPQMLTNVRNNDRLVFDDLEMAAEGTHHGV